MAYIKWVWCHIYSWSEIINSMFVMTQIQWMQCQIEWEWYHEYSACDAINNVVWCHKMWMWCLIECIWCYTYSGCDVLHTKGVISSKVWVWGHTYIGCDVVYKGYDVIYSGWDLIDTVGEISSIQWMWLQKYSGYNLKYSGCDVIKTVVWCHKVRMWCLVECKICHSYAECDVIQSGCDDGNRVCVMTQLSGYDDTCIVYMLPYILDVVSYIEVVMS